MSSSGQLRSRSGLVQVWFSLELKFNSLELDSEVGRLVSYLNLVNWTLFGLGIRACQFLPKRYLQFMCFVWLKTCVVLSGFNVKPSEAMTVEL